ncbi:hypothetical protein [Spirosoma rhododendri]|uniref:Uncharacterized protein n=1 Tax=Spirosoma rhododendri TaxID=2728024 RepID=A0A7L5DPJ2_9BACT|nr:hypothetical protein [Spirosoma rhododendri]QJD80359.1 hypothetical protein HH216_19450 [Spirosoma rhododendri]
MLEATLDSSFNFIQVFKAVRDQSGQIIDFVWVLTNRRWQQAYGDIIGKSLLELNPAVVQTGVFARLVDVTQTGVAQTHEHYYPFEQFNGWFHQTLTKLQDGVVLTTEDITIRKQAEILQAFLLTLSDHLGQMVDDLLDVSRISQGKIQLKKKCLDLGQLVEQALESIRAVANPEVRS